MILDARKVPDGSTLQADVCVIGAGVAGIALTRELRGRGLSVCVIESGGVEEEPAYLDVSRGENVGLPYRQLESGRYRRFGGHSHRWNVKVGGGRVGLKLAPLTDVDFEKRPGLPYSGWPFRRSELEPFYRRAYRLFGLGAVSELGTEVEAWSDPRATPVLALGDSVRSTVFHFGRPEPFFDDFFHELRAAPDVRVLLHGTATELDASPSAPRLERVRVACLQGTRFWVAARLYVLAAGGTENPRLLMASDSVRRCGVGNEHGLVGRFFMEHLHFTSGYVLPDDPVVLGRIAFYRTHRACSVPIMAMLTLHDEALRRHRLLNFSAALMPHYHEESSADAVAFQELRRLLRRRGIGAALAGSSQHAARSWPRLTRHLLRRVGARLGAKPRTNALRLYAMTEQSPNPDSRITLSPERDALGVRRVRLDWRIDPADIDSVVRAQAIVGEELRRAGLGSLSSALREGMLPPGLKGGWHHMGTTRMHDDPRQGVVDRDCRVHGTANLFIAGSSVFPTGGYANPTLTIAALALRLSERIITELGPSSPSASAH